MQTRLADALNKAKVTADSIRDTVAWQPLALYACETDVELQAHLEREALEAVNIQSCHDVLKRWVRHAAGMGEVRMYRTADTHFWRQLFLEDSPSDDQDEALERKPAHLTFQEVFIRSNALEIFLTTVARRSDVRNFLLLIGQDPDDAGGESAGGKGLQAREATLEGKTRTRDTAFRARDELLKLVKLTLDLSPGPSRSGTDSTGGDATPSRSYSRLKLFLEVVYLLSTTSEACFVNLPFLSCVVTLLKCDWRQSFCQRRRAECEVQLERLKDELMNVIVPPVGEVAESDAKADVIEVDMHQKQHEKRVNLSRQYVELCALTLSRESRLRAAQVRVTEAKREFVKKTLVDIEGAERKHEGSAGTSESREASLREELTKSTDQISDEIQMADSILREIDTKIEIATTKRTEIVAELKSVDSELEALVKQRNSQLTTIENLQEGLSVFAAKTKRKLSGEETLRKNSKLQYEDLGNVRRLLQESGSGLLVGTFVDCESPVSAASGEPSKQELLEESVMRHLAYEKGRLQHLLELLSSCVKALKQATGKEGGSPDASCREQAVRARHLFAKALSDLDDVVWPAIQKFIAARKEIINRRAGGAATDVVTELDRLYRKIKVDAAPHFSEFLLG